MSPMIGYFNLPETLNNQANQMVNKKYKSAGIDHHQFKP